MSWPLVQLGDLEAYKGAFVDGPFGSNLKASEYTATGVPIIRLQNIRPNFYRDKGVKFVSGDKAIELQRHSYKAGDVVIAKLGAVGTACIIPQELPDGIIVADIVRFRSDESRVNHKYLCYYLNSLEGQQRVLKLSRGTTRIRTNLSDLKKVEIPLPPLAEQKRIAAILDKADQLRQKRQQAINLADEFVRSVFLEMFGDPVTNPKGWPEKELRDVLKIKHGHAFKSEFFKSAGDYVLLTPGNFFEKGGYRDRGEKQKYYVGEIPKEYILKKDDLLVAMTEQAAGLLGSSILVPAPNNFLHNQRLGLVENDSSLTNRVFLAHLFNQQSVREVIHAKATGIKVRHTSPTKIEAIKIGLPPLELQKKFANAVRRLEKTQGRCFTMTKEIATLFKSLSQKAFAGEL